MEHTECDMSETPITEGKVRLLTLGERNISERIFHNSIEYHNVWIHCDSYLPFGMQSKNVAMSPNGEIYLRKELYERDFSCSVISKIHLFIHEMTHIWQLEHGVWVKTIGLTSWFAKYKYVLKKDKPLKYYSMEQQAQIIADYYILKFEGWTEWSFGLGDYIGYEGKPDRKILELYEDTLKNFPRKI